MDNSLLTMKNIITVILAIILLNLIFSIPLWFILKYVNFINYNFSFIDCVLIVFIVMTFKTIPNLSLLSQSIIDSGDK